MKLSGAQKGLAFLPLHYGKAPSWLVTRMTKMAKEIVTILVDEYGQDVFLQRISDPYWFQALGCVLGYDWHSSGVTTVLTGVLKTAISPEEHGMTICGGKGVLSTRAPIEIAEAGEKLNLATDAVAKLQYASRMSAKVDNTAIQTGYPLYHHAFFLTETGKWAVVQQGMNTMDRTARRYHWLSDHVKEFVAEPHDAIVGDTKRDVALDMTAKDSKACRKASIDIAQEPPRKIARTLQSIRPTYQKSLQEWMPDATAKEYAKNVLVMPRNISWKTLTRMYEFKPKNYEELLGIRGVGSSTVRGIALIAELVYGQAPSWKDPVKYSFAYGGKDGVPFPVDKKAMDESIHILRTAVENARIGDKERLNSLQRLRRYTLT
jgi:hypothetical protein